MWRRNIKVSMTIYDYFSSLIKYNVNYIGISEILVRESKDEVAINITLDKPGYFIGSKGVHINNVTTKLEERFPNKKVEINLTESTLWNWSKYVD